MSRVWATCRMTDYDQLDRVIRSMLLEASIIPRASGHFDVAYIQLVS